MRAHNSSKDVSIEIEGCTMTKGARRAQRNSPEEVTVDVGFQGRVETF